MTREEIIKEIKETEERLRELKDKLGNTPTTSLKEQFQNVLIKGESKDFLIKYTSGGFIDEYVKSRLYNYVRGETVDVYDLIEGLLEDYLVDNYEDYLEISDILEDEEILDEDEYLECKTERKPKQYFLDFINDVIEAGVSEFKIDW